MNSSKSELYYCTDFSQSGPDTYKLLTCKQSWGWSRDIFGNARLALFNLVDSGSQSRSKLNIKESEGTFGAGIWILQQSAVESHGNLFDSSALLVRISIARCGKNLSRVLNKFCHKYSCARPHMSILVSWVIFGILLAYAYVS